MKSRLNENNIFCMCGLKLSKIKNLYLNDNSIGNKGLQFILTTLLHNQTLQSLHLPNNNISDSGIQFLYDFLRMIVCYVITQKLIHPSNTWIFKTIISFRLYRLISSLPWIQHTVLTLQCLSILLLWNLISDCNLNHLGPALMSWWSTNPIRMRVWSSRCFGWFCICKTCMTERSRWH